MSSDCPPFKAACVQLRAGRDMARNFEEASTLIREAARAGAGLVVTPEMTNVLESRRDDLLAKVRPQAEDASVAGFSALSRELGIHLVIGSLALRAGPDLAVNRSLLFGPDGAVMARYDKIHLFDVELAGGESYRESRTYRGGREAALADLPWGRIGLTICYDMRFPALYRLLAEAGAQYITVPSAFTVQTGQAHWHVLLRARAIECGAYILAPAQGGRHESGRETYGHSIIISPWGEVLAEAEAEPGVLLAEIDPAKVAEARHRIPGLLHARPAATLQRPDSLLAAS